MKRVQEIEELLLSIISECSGMAGTSTFENCSFEKFKEWFKNDIQHNTPRTREIGEELLKLFK